MSAITKVSEITVENLENYLRLSEVSSDDEDTLSTLLSVAIAYIVNYTGQTEENLDNFPEFVIAVYVLVQDMWDNRTLYVDKTNLNKTVESILGLHQINLLPESDDDDDDDSESDDD